MTRIVTTAYRYKRPRKRKTVGLTLLGDVHDTARRTMADYARSMADCNAAAHLADAAVAFLRAHRAAKN